MAAAQQPIVLCHRIPLANRLKTQCQNSKAAFYFRDGLEQVTLLYALVSLSAVIEKE